jgi:hypothetical protein
MKKRHAAVCLIVLLAMAAESRAVVVTVTVTVQNEQGLPLEHVPIGIHAPEPLQLKLVFTDPAGQASAELSLSDDSDEISAFLYDGAQAGVSPEVVSIATARYHAVARKFAFRHCYSMPVVPGQVAYAISIVAYDAVTVTGRIANQPLWADERVLVRVRRGAWSGFFEVGEKIIVRGVRKGAPAELLIDYKSNQVYTKRLTEDQTRSDIDLGDIVLPSLAGDATIDVTVANYANQWGPGGLQPLWRFATLIRADGEMILAYPRAPFGKLVTGPDDDDVEDPMALPKVPAGTYYIAPGMFGGKLQDRLLDAVRAGQHEVLDQHNVPKIVAVAGQSVSLTFDVVQARDAIMAATGNN